MDNCPSICLIYGRLGCVKFLKCLLTGMTLSPAIAITILNIGISFWAVTFCLCSDSRRYAYISIRSPEIQYPRAAEDDNIALFCGSSLKFALFISNRIVLSGIALQKAAVLAK